MPAWLLPPRASKTGDLAAAPIRRYRPGDVLFSTPAYTLLANGGRAITRPSLAELPDTVAAALTGHDSDGMAIGAVSFDGTSCRLTIPEQVTRHDPLPARTCIRRGSGGWDIVPTPSTEDYVKMVRLARDRIAAGEADKVVLARTLTATSSRAVNLTDLLIHLGGRRAYTFAVPLGRGRRLIGASPELLISRRGRSLTTNPLAGSAQRQPDPAVDRAAAHRLLDSAKDRREHQLVVESVAAALAPYCATLEVPAGPQLQSTATMWHLGTKITATLADPAITSLHLAAALHPTPAVCGTPTPAAQALLTGLESGCGVERGWYAGLVGWQDAAGDGEWALTLRCGVMNGPRRLRLWAGSGIVADSDPEAELAETDAKLATMLHALHAVPR